MRKNIVAGNWKMNKNLQEGVELAKELNEALKSKTINCDVVIGTPFIHLATVANSVDGDRIGVAAQNCSDKVSGAYTGEVSAEMVASTGAKKPSVSLWETTVTDSMAFSETTTETLTRPILPMASPS